MSSVALTLYGDVPDCVIRPETFVHQAIAQWPGVLVGFVLGFLWCAWMVRSVSREIRRQKKDAES